MKRPTPLGSIDLTDDINQAALMLAVILKKSSSWPCRLQQQVNQPAVSEQCLCAEIKELV